MSKVTFDDHPDFKNISEPVENVYSDGLKMRCDKNKPIGDNMIFKKLGIYVNKLIDEKKLPLRRKDLQGSYSWQASDTRLGGSTLLKLCHYDVDDYFYGIREVWAKLNNIHDQIMPLCSYRFVVPPQINVEFIGFPCMASADLDKIKEIINFIPSTPKFNQQPR
jgi:hypothetical protein